MYRKIKGVKFDILSMRFFNLPLFVIICVKANYEWITKVSNQITDQEIMPPWLFDDWSIGKRVNHVIELIHPKLK